MALRKKLLLFLLVLTVFILHQDFWNWKRLEPLLFEILPIGLTYHVGYSIAAAVMMAILVRVAWPRHLEDAQPEENERDK